VGSYNFADSITGGRTGINRRDESRKFHNVVSSTDFDWYLRAV
jgi:hypothetical protein